MSSFRTGGKALRAALHQWESCVSRISRSSGISHCALLDQGCAVGRPSPLLLGRPSWIMSWHTDQVKMGRHNSPKFAIKPGRRVRLGLGCGGPVKSAGFVARACLCPVTPDSRVGGRP
jgi:hypothetical protein